jgi:hypothetical protein
VNGKISGVKFFGASLSLQADTVLSAYFSFDDESKYTVKLNGKKATVEDGVLDISGIKAADLGEENEITISDGKNTMTIKISALTWAYTIVNGKGSDTNSINMAKMVYRYNKAAEDYFAKH